MKRAKLIEIPEAVYGEIKVTKAVWKEVVIAGSGRPTIIKNQNIANQSVALDSTSGRR